MDTELSTAAGGGGVASPAPSQGGVNPAAAVGTVPDSRLADILRRRGEGEKLSASDRGYLGAKLRANAPRKPAQPNANPLLVGVQPAPPADNPLFGSQAGADAPGAGAPAAAVDSVLLRKTAGALLDSIDGITQRLISKQAEKAGADVETVRKWRDAVAMKDSKELMLEGSEPMILWLCEQCGCGPEALGSKLQGGGFMAGLAMWGFGVYSAVSGLKELTRERAERAVRALAESPAVATATKPG